MVREWRRPQPRVYSRSEIASLYSAHRRGAYAGREAEWARQEADLIAAGREGRVANPQPTLKNWLDGK
jgi:hypothetical protein